MGCEALSTWRASLLLSDVAVQVPSLFTFDLPLSLWSLLCPLTVGVSQGCTLGSHP